MIYAAQSNSLARTLNEGFYNIWVNIARNPLCGAAEDWMASDAYPLRDA